jgi:hypothetical protein
MKFLIFLLVLPLLGCETTMTPQQAAAYLAAHRNDPGFDDPIGYGIAQRQAQQQAEQARIDAENEQREIIRSEVANLLNAQGH